MDTISSVNTLPTQPQTTTAPAPAPAKSDDVGAVQKELEQIANDTKGTLAQLNKDKVEFSTKKPDAAPATETKPEEKTNAPAPKDAAPVSTEAPKTDTAPVVEKPTPETTKA